MTAFGDIKFCVLNLNPILFFLLSLNVPTKKVFFPPSIYKIRQYVVGVQIIDDSHKLLTKVDCTQQHKLYFGACYNCKLSQGKQSKLNKFILLLYNYINLTPLTNETLNFFMFNVFNQFMNFTFLISKSIF